MVKRTDSGITIEEQVAHKLRDAGLDFQSQPIVGQARPDFLVKAPDGHNIVIEVKGWSDNPENIRRASHQAETYKKLG